MLPEFFLELTLKFGLANIAFGKNNIFQNTTLSDLRFYFKNIKSRVAAVFT